MLPFLLLPLWAAHRKRRSLRALRTAWDLLPLLIVELLYIGCVFSVTLGEYGLIRYAKVLQWAFLLSLLFPILRRQLYVPALWGSFCTVLGSALNRLVINANGGKMPVWPTLSQWTGYCTREMLLSSTDQLHILMDGSSRLRFLADYLDLGWCILSPGDVLNHLFISLILYKALLSFPEDTKQKL